MNAKKLFAFATLAITASRAFAVNGAQHYTPVVNEAGLLTLHSSSYGESSKLGIGLNYNLAIDPAETNESRGKLKNYLHSINLGVGSKLMDRLHIFADFSGHMVSPKASDLKTTYGNDADKFTFGNVKVGLGYSLIDNSEGGFGVGITPHIVAPIGTKNGYLDGPRDGKGHRTWQYGATVAVDYRLVHKDYLVMNIGWDRRQTDDYLTWGFGYEKPIFHGDNQYAILEIRGEQSVEDPKVPNSDPLEIDLAYKAYCHDRRGSYTAGIGRGFNNNDGSPDLRVFLGVNWQLDHTHKVAYEAPVAEPTPITPAEIAPPPAAAVPAPKAAEEKVVVGQSTLKVSKIYFATNKDTILEKSFPALDKLATDLNANPGLTKLQVEGYTDNVGNADYNKALSKKRADSVKTYLVKRGVDEKRLSSEGFGADSPIDSNDTPKGRANNRRVEFRILEVASNIKIDLAE